MNKKLKICIVGPGIMPIPPTGWGAVEILIWDYKETLEKFGHEVHIINTRDPRSIIEQANAIGPDFIHIQYDDYWAVENRFQCKNIAITSHYGYLSQPNRHGYYSNTFNGFLGMTTAKIFSLSQENSDVYTDRGFPKDRIFLTPNGVRTDLFKFDEICKRPKESICLAKIDFRKRQHVLHDIFNLYFAGNIADSRYNKNNYLGEWDKPTLYSNLTHFANLVLLSDGEAHPLVCMEALAAGLGLVISEFATANLDLSLPFIDVIPEAKMDDLPFISDVIAKNRVKSIGIRGEIHEYAVKNFSWDTIVEKYLKTVEKILE